jgi:CubicO group peptidase (beta-lactamase class C family)
MMANIVISVLYFWAAIHLHPGEPPTPASLTAALAEERRQALITDRFGGLFATLAAEEGFNGNVLLSHNGKVLYKHAFGYADLRSRAPLLIESAFQLASVSKQFTSVAIMILHDQGRLDFNDPIRKYFPALPYSDVTIRHLLGHRSGIPDYMNFAGRYWKNKNEYLTNSGLVQMLIARHPRLEFTPDRRYKYSNTGYALLASIVEHVSGLSFDDFMQQQVFSPLGMNNTTVFNPNKRNRLLFQTTGYNKNTAPAHEDYLSGVVGDKGVYSTVDDLFKWDQALYTARLVKQSTLDEAFTPLHRKFKDDNNYGYGWRIARDGGEKKIEYHAGWWRGYTSLCVRRPEDKTCIIVLSNTVNWCFRNIDRLLDIVDSKEIDVMAMQGD